MPLFDSDAEVQVGFGETNITGSTSNKAAVLIAGVSPSNTASFLKISEASSVLISGSVGLTESVPLTIGSFSANVTSSIKVVATEVTQSVTGSVFVFNNSTMPLWNTGSITVNNFPSVQTITGTVDVASVAAPITVIQGQSGSLAWKITGSATINSVAAPVTVTQGVSGSLPWKTDQNEYATFIVGVTGAQIGNNKNMLSIMNAQGSNVVIRLLKIQIMNVQLANVTGITAIFNFLRIADHSGGTIINAVPHDTFSTTSSFVTTRTNSTVTGSTTSFFRVLRATDERNTAGSLDSETFEYIFSQVFGDYSLPLKARPITLRAGEGVSIRQTANSTTGTFDVYFLFTQEGP